MHLPPPSPDARIALFALEQFGIKLGLEQIRELLRALRHPELAFPSIVIAGTNGKGSVTAMVERGLRAAGYRTGRYTSPHLLHIEERFAIDGVAIGASVFEAAAARVLAAAAALPAPPSFFEATTALALDVFREAHVDVAVLEVGLGGRLDATNAVDSIAVAITAVDFDHEQYLGHTLREIAAEKAGVIKPHSLVVLGDNPPDVEAVVVARCAEAGATLVRAKDGTTLETTMVAGQAHLTVRSPAGLYEDIRLGLRGRHQVTNALTALRLLETLTGFDVGPAARRTALEDVVWPARLELTRVDDATVLIDGAHNPAGARALSAYIAETYGRPLPMVIGIMRDKQIDAMIAAFATSASAFVFTAPTSTRAASPAELAAVAARVAPHLPASMSNDPRAAIRSAATVGSPVVVAGSLYLAGEVR